MTSGWSPTTDGRLVITGEFTELFWPFGFFWSYYAEFPARYPHMIHLNDGRAYQILAFGICIRVPEWRWHKRRCEKEMEANHGSR